MTDLRLPHGSVPGSGSGYGKGGGPGGSVLAARKPSWRRRIANHVATVLMVAATVIVVVPVVLILYHITKNGLAAMSWEFLTQSMPFTYRRAEGGMLNAFIGTMLMVGIATVISVPLGVLAAVYLVEYGKKNLTAKVIRFFSDVMTGVPSVFVGLFVYTAFVVNIGFGALLGGLSLAIIMMPIVVRSTEEMLKLVPRDLKEASYGLGAAKWQTVTKVVLPSALPGIVTGIMLAVARAAGETAPLILTALGSLNIVFNLVDEPISALPLAIFAGARNPFPAGQQMAWAGALQLLIIVLVFTLLARYFSSRSKISR